MRFWPFARPERPPVPLVLYTRAGCGLCDEMLAVIERTPLGRAHVLSQVDITSDPELLAAYSRSIPVLSIAGRIAFKGRMDADAFRRKFARLAREEGY